MLPCSRKGNVMLLCRLDFWAKTPNLDDPYTYSIVVLYDNHLSKIIDLDSVPGIWNVCFIWIIRVGAHQNNSWSTFEDNSPIIPSWMLFCVESVPCKLILNCMCCLQSVSKCFCTEALFGRRRARCNVVSRCQTSFSLCHWAQWQREKRGLATRD